MPAVETVLLYVILGAVIGIVWSLRKIYILEARLIALDLKIEKLIENLLKKSKKK